MNKLIYKIVPAKLWRQAESDGTFKGAGIDLVDGFIHLSTGKQVAETARLYFHGVEDLLLVAVNADALGTQLVFEPSRDGALFPHLYGALDLSSVISATPMPLGPDGNHIITLEAE